jgi:uncharacterized protein (DUF2164 family)
MGFLDKVKEQAAVATAVAKDAAQKGQAKIDDLQAKRAADALLRDLGAAYYAQQTGRSTPTTDADVQRLIEQLKGHEALNGTVSLTPEAAAPTSSAPSTPAGPPSAAPATWPPSGPQPENPTPA